MRPLIALVIALSFSDFTAGDEPREGLVKAAEALESLGGYQWTTVTETTLGDRTTSGKVAGETVTGQLTRATVSWGRFETSVFILDSRAAVQNREGKWEAVSLEDEGYRSSGFAPATARSIFLPSLEAKTLIAAAEQLRVDGGKVIGLLPAAEASRRLANRRIDADEVRTASGTVEFAIEDGRLGGYKISVMGTVSDEGETRGAAQRVEVSIDPLAVLTIPLPEAAAEALERPLPPPQKRLGEEEAKRWLAERGKRNAEVHDPSSIVRSGGRYWLFATGIGIQSWSSKDLVEWERGPRVFPEMPEWASDVAAGQRGHFWAPDVIEMDGRYFLYYSVSSFGVNTSAIALATSPTLDPSDPEYGWTDRGIVIRSGRGDSFNAIDPAVFRAEDGRFWLSFGSFWDGIKLTELDAESGKRIEPDSPLHSLARYEAVEAPHIYFHDGYYYLFVNWDLCCRGVDSTYNIRVGRSRSVTGPYLDREGVDLAAGGGTPFLASDGPFFGPGHANVFRDRDRYWFSCHFYDGTAGGRAMLAIRELRWGEDGWPVLETPPASNAEPKQR